MSNKSNMLQNMYAEPFSFREIRLSSAVSHFFNTCKWKAIIAAVERKPCKRSRVISWELKLFWLGSKKSDWHQFSWKAHDRLLYIWFKNNEALKCSFDTLSHFKVLCLSKTKILRLCARLLNNSLAYFKKDSPFGGLQREFIFTL